MKHLKKMKTKDKNIHKVQRFDSSLFVESAKAFSAESPKSNKHKVEKNNPWFKSKILGKALGN